MSTARSNSVAFERVARRSHFGQPCIGPGLGLALMALVGCSPAPVPSPQPSSPVASAHPSAAAQSTLDALVSTKDSEGFIDIDDSNLKDSMPPFRAVIVPESAAGRFGFIGGHLAHFTPTVDQALRVGQRLPEYLASNQPKISKRFLSYRFQILGFVENGKEMLFVNAFCNPPADWKREPVMVDDGGDCYFMFHMDPETLTISRFEVNGDG